MDRLIDPEPINAIGQNGERLRQQVKEQHQTLLLVLQKVSHAHGKYLFEGKWRTREELPLCYRELKRKDRRVFCEIMVLFLLLAGAAGCCILVLYSLCC